MVAICELDYLKAQFDEKDDCIKTLEETNEELSKNTQKVEQDLQTERIRFQEALQEKNNQINSQHEQIQKYVEILLLLFIYHGVILSCLC